MAVRIFSFFRRLIKFRAEAIPSRLVYLVKLSIRPAWGEEGGELWLSGSKAVEKI